MEKDYTFKTVKPSLLMNLVILGSLLLSHHCNAQWAKYINDNPICTYKISPPGGTNNEYLDSVVSEGQYSTTKAKIIYSEDGYICKEKFFTYDSYDDEWEVTSWYEYSFNELMYNTEIRQFGRLVYPNYIDKFYYEYEYNADGYILSSTEYIRSDVEDINSDWYGTGTRTEHRYDEENRVTDKAYYRWSEYTKDWVGSETRYTYLYDSKDNIIETINYKWSDDDLEWIPELRINKLFDSEGREITVEEYLWNVSSGLWDGRVKYDFAYDNYGNQIEYSKYRWDIYEMRWKGDTHLTHAFTEAGNELYEAHYNWNHETSEWLTFYKDVWEYNSNELLVSRYRMFGVEGTTSEWELIDYTKKDYSEYDERGHMIYDSEWYWDAADNEWKESETGKRKFTCDYNDSENSVEIDEYWWVNDHWDLRYRVVEISNGNGDMLEYNPYKLEGDEWIKRSDRKTWGYDASNNLIEEVDYTLTDNDDGTEFDWEPSRKIQRKYDTNNNKIEEVWYQWNNSTKKIEDHASTKTVWRYDSNNNLEYYCPFEWDSSEGEWLIKISNGFEDTDFDDNNNITSILYYERSSDRKERIPKLKYIWEYDAEERITKSAVYKWIIEDEKWIAFLNQKTFEYDHAGNMTNYTRYTWDSSTDSWTMTWKQVWSYTEYNNLKEDMIFLYDTEIDNWSDTPIEYDLFFYTSIPTIATFNENVVAESSVSVYPNPVQLTLRVDIQTTDSEIMIYDVNGRCIYKERAAAPLSIDVSAWVAGLYYYSVVQKSTVTSGNFLKL